MTFTGLLIVLFIAFMISLVASLGFRSHGPWGSFWVFFLILFLAGLAGSVWIDPTGPQFWGTAWIPITFVVLLFAILLIAATPSSARVRRRSANVEAPVQAPGPGAEEESSTGSVVLGAFFWILLVLLAFSILFGALSRNTEPVTPPVMNEDLTYVAPPDTTPIAGK